MKNAGLYKIIIIILVVLNLCTLAFMWFNRPGRERTEQNAGAAATFLIKELGLSDAQQVQYQELRHQHREMLDKLDAHDRELHKRFFDLLLLEKADSVSMEALADSIAANRKQMEIVTYDHFFRINKILNPEQQKKFTLIFQDVMQMVLPPPPPPPGQLPPPPPPPPPAPAPKN